MAVIAWDPYPIGYSEYFGQYGQRDIVRKVVSQNKFYFYLWASFVKFSGPVINIAYSLIHLFILKWCESKIQILQIGTYHNFHQLDSTLRLFLKKKKKSHDLSLAVDSFLLIYLE